MRLFDIFKKKNIKPDILTIAYDTNGYDIKFISGKTDPIIYNDINNLITNNNFDINFIENYKVLNTNSSEDTFIEFYDLWIKKLIEMGYIVHLNDYMGMNEFCNKINDLLKLISNNVQLNVENLLERYKEEISKYSSSGENIDEKFNYDVLEANIVANELRKYGYELINLYIGFDNYDKAIIKIDDIKKMEELSNE